MNGVENVALVEGDDVVAMEQHGGADAMAMPSTAATIGLALSASE